MSKRRSRLYLLPAPTKAPLWHFPPKRCGSAGCDGHAPWLVVNRERTFWWVWGRRDALLCEAVCMYSGVWGKQQAELYHHTESKSDFDRSRGELRCDNTVHTNTHTVCCKDESRPQGQYIIMQHGHQKWLIVHLKNPISPLNSIILRWQALITQVTSEMIWDIVGILQLHGRFTQIHPGELFWNNIFYVL